MTNLRRLAVIFLLAAGWSLAGVQGADAQEQQTRPRLWVTIPDPPPAPEAPAPEAPAPGKDFSAGRRAGAIFMNPLLGLGSYTMGDWRGGLTISAGYLITGGLILWEIFGFDHDDKSAGVPGLAGIGVGGVTTIFGILRPIFYHRPGAGSKAAAVLGGVHIAVIPAALPQSSGIRAVRLSYRFQF
jgi:hypothetical protein